MLTLGSAIFPAAINRAIVGLALGFGILGAAGQAAVLPPQDAIAFRSKSYKVFSETLTWTAAKEKCEQLGGRLATVSDNETWTFVRNLTGNPVWLGANDAEQEGIWKWTDGSVMTFAVWGRNQPDNHKQLEHYLTTFQGQWSDVQNTFQSSKGFICEWDAVAAIPIAGRWNVRFPNGVVKVFNIDATGKLNFLDSMHGAITGQLEKTAEGIYAIEFNDKKVERLSLTTAGELSVEHWQSRQERDAGKRPMFAKGMRISIPASTVSPAPPTSPVQVQPSPAKPTLVLRPGWDSLHQGGQVTIRDLALALQGIGQPNANPSVDAPITMFEGVNYLMPFKEAVKALGLERKPPTRKKVACPGFPKDALDCVIYDGLWEGRFNRLILVVDSADQVVSVQLVDETPKSVEDSRTELMNTYNFAETRLKSLGALRVFCKTYVQNPRTKDWMNEFRTGDTKTPPQLVRVDSWVKNGQKPLEYVRWYAPMPFVDLLQYCIERNTKGR